MNFSENDVGKKVTNKISGEVTYIKSFAERPSLSLANGIGFANGSPISDNWELVDEEKTLSDKQIHATSGSTTLAYNDVREHIKGYREKMDNLHRSAYSGQDMITKEHDIAEEIFGKELIE